MRVRGLSTALGFGAVAIASTANAQATAVTSGEARASIVRTISLASQTPLSFGLIAPESTPVDVTVTPDGDISSSQPGVLIPSVVSAGGFEVQGEPDRIYFIDLPDSITLTAGEGNDSMTVTALALECESVGQVLAPEGVDAAATSSCQLGVDGRQVFNVGGTLGVGASQSPGEYVGTYAVTARYQ